MRRAVPIALVLLATSMPANAVEVAVDCAAGERIADALRTPAASLIVRVSGICEEDVEIDRGDVTLAGSDPALDGIVGAGGPDVLSIRGVTGVRIERLSIAAPSARVLVGRTAEATIVESDLSATRVEATQRAQLRLNDDRLGSLRVDLAASVFSFRSSMERLDVLDGGFAYLGGGYAWFPPTVIDVGVVRGTVELWNAFVDGRLDATDSVVGMRQSRVERGATLRGSSYLELRERSDVFGPLIVTDFSDVRIEPYGSYLGSLVCMQGGDASCREVNLSGYIQGCPTCALSEGTPNPITVTYEGTLYRVDEGVADVMAVGDPFSMTFTYNAATPGRYGGFENAVWELSASIGELSWSGGPGSCRVYDDTGLGDEFGCGASGYDLSGPRLDGFRVEWIELTLRDPTGAAFESVDELPDPPPDPADFELARVELAFGPWLVRSTVGPPIVGR